LEIYLLDTSQHERLSFHCEEESLTEYLKIRASQDMKRGLAACFVMINDVRQIIGYYTLSNDSLDRSEIPEAYQSKVPKHYKVPVTLLGRLARDISRRGTRCGEILLLDALYRSYRISLTNIGSMAVVVDPINEQAVRFYSRYGFVLLPDSGKMFLPMKTISRLFNTTGDASSATVDPA